MDINVNVKFDLSPNAYGVLLALLTGNPAAVKDAVANTTGAAPAAAASAASTGEAGAKKTREKAQAPVKELPKAQGAATGVNLSASEDQPAADPAAGANGNGQAASSTLDLETIRVKVVALRDAGKKSATANLMKDKYGIQKLSDLPTDQYEAFYADLNGIQ